jgi:hypothetical protein
LKLSDCINYEKIKPILSTHDMATFLAFQRHLGDLVGPARGTQYGAIVQQYGYELEMLFCRYTDTWEPDTKTTRRNWNLPTKDYFNVAMLAGDSSFEVDIKARLYGADNRMPQYDHAFDIVNDIAPNVAGVIVYPGFFNEITDHSLQLELVEALLKVFYGNAAPFHEVAPQSLFKRFLELLSLVK